MTTHQPDQPAPIQTNGGAHVRGNVSTGGGDFIGRDKKTFNITSPWVWVTGALLLSAAVCCAAVIIALVIATKPFTAIVPTEPAFDEKVASVGIEGQKGDVLVAYNAHGLPVWRKEIGTHIVKAALTDLDGEGGQEIVIGLIEPGERPGWFLVYNEAGAIITEFNVWQPSIYRGGSKEAANIVAFEVVDLIGDGTKQLVTLADDTYWYASKLEVLEFSGGQFHRVARYWHPGLLYTLNMADINHDGVMEIVVTGENNDLQALAPIGGNVSAVFGIRGDQITGQAPPYFGDDQPGSEAWYGYVLPRGTRVTEVDFEDVDRDGNEEVHITLSDACSYYLNFVGEVIGAGKGSACQNDSELIILGK